MAKEKNTQKNSAKKGSGFFATLGRWTKRMFWGGSRELADSDVFSVEDIESPTKQAVKTFFRRKLAVVALIVLLALFLFVFIGPLFIPVDFNYTDPLQSNMAPIWSMRNVPSGLKNNIRDINGYSNFTLGVSNDNDLYIWGATTDSLTKIDYAKFPDEIKDGNVYLASAGADHIIAITTDGKLVGWGDSSRGQLGVNTGNSDDPVLELDKDILNNGVDISKVDQLICGYQVSALVVDGELHLWGNTNNCLNLKQTAEAGYKNVKKVAFSNFYVALLLDDGTVVADGNIFSFATAVNSKGEKVPNFTSYFEDHKVIDIVATDNCFAFLTEDGEVIMYSNSEYGEDQMVAIPDGEKVVSLVAGTRHLVALTDAGKAYGWGYNGDNQVSFNGAEAASVYTGSKQTYLVDEDGALIKSYGLKGYLFGTDNLGRDTFTRIVHGGKMTMTIGAVAVIISTLIAIIVGCLSGYFGGWVDMLLMRVTEIVSSLPFLPFAMMLSIVMQTKPLSQTTRIFIIMVILGILSWTGLARMIRAQVLSEREKEFVIAAKSMGVKEHKIAFKHILPNVISIILVSVTLDFAGCMLTESSLSYLGFGVSQPQPTWGNMINGANNSIVIQNYWWQWLFPAIFLAIATICINIIGDTLRDVLDPKSSREK